MPDEVGTSRTAFASQHAFLTTGPAPYDHTTLHESCQGLPFSVAHRAIPLYCWTSVPLVRATEKLLQRHGLVVDEEPLSPAGELRNGGAIP